MTDNHHIVKPRLFISHATSDGDFANAVKQELEKVFANGLEVFCTSSPGAIAPGTDWLNEIEARLASTQAVIPIMGFPRFRGHGSGVHRGECTGSDERLLVVDRTQVADR
jgi:hypothetical protein